MSDSGLILPGHAGSPARPSELPTSLEPPATPIAIRRSGRPTGLDQVAVHFAESEMNVPPSRLRDVRAHLAEVPFEPGMYAMARVAARAFAQRFDSAAQLRLAEEVFAGHPALSDMRRFLAHHSNAVLLTEQQAFVVMRLLIERGAHGVLGDGISAVAAGHLQAALLGATSILDQDASEMESALSHDLNAVVAYFLRNGASNRKPQLLAELVRAQELFGRIARSPEMAGSEHFCPIDEWMQEDYGFDVQEQLSFGFALAAMAGAMSNDDTAGSKAIIASEDLDDLLEKLGWAGRKEVALNLLAGERGLYEEAFEVGASPSDIAFELRPFMKRPFLRLANDGLLLLSPRAFVGWVTEGFHYRALDAAQRRNTGQRHKMSRLYTAFAGNLLEQWCVELAEAALAGRGTVFPEQPYGRKGEAKTSDLAILVGTDLVLVEVTVSRLRAETLTAASPKSAVEDLERMVVAKAKQIDGCVSALAKGTAVIPAGEEPQVLWGAVERVWPVVVTGGDIMQNEFVWEWIRGATKGLLEQPKVQPLTLLDIEAYESLMGIIEAGTPLLDVLEGTTSEAFRDLELAIYLRHDPKVPQGKPPRSKLIDSAFRLAMARAQEQLGFSGSEGVAE